LKVVWQEAGDPDGLACLSPQVISEMPVAKITVSYSTGVVQHRHRHSHRADSGFPLVSVMRGAGVNLGALPEVIVYYDLDFR
jgi:hypothetical protein